MASESKATTIFIWTYWIVGLLAVGSMCNILYTKFNKQVASILVFLASFMALYYYYVKWFVIGDTFQPPISVCPDYLTLVGPIKEGSSQFVCVDRLGVSSKFAMIGSTSATPSAEGALATVGITEAEIDGAEIKKGTVRPNLLGTGGVVVTPDIASKDMNTITNYCNALESAGLTAINMCSNKSA